MAKWYQNAVINGEVMPAQRRNDTSQRRWAELLEPLIPPDGNGRLFVDLGCNAGYYLREASQLGYTTLGVEKESAYHEHAKYWEAQEPRGVRVEFGDINDYDVPANYLTVIANVHYWLTPEQVDKLVAKLRRVSMHVLIVSRNKPDKRHLSDCSELTLCQTFDGWEYLDRCDTEKHFSVIYKNTDLVEFDTANLFNIQAFTRSTQFLSAWREYIDLVISRRRYNLNHTSYYKYTQWRGWRNQNAHLRRLRRIILLAERDGISKPLEVHPNGLIIDGNHRLIIAEKLGIKKVICKLSSI